MLFSSSSKPYVIYVPGFRSADDPQEKVLQMLKTIYPNAEEICNFPWENYDSNMISSALRIIIPTLPTQLPLLGDIAIRTFFNSLGLGSPLTLITQWTSIIDRWKKALRDIVPTAQLLADKITSLSSVKRKNVILVGHSLGANIVVRTLAHLNRTVTIKQAVLMGAAMNNNDPQILDAIKATSEPVYSMVNPDDLALFIYRQVEGCQALGTGCTLNVDPHRFIEHCVPTDFTKTGGHASELYLAQWAKVCGVSDNSLVSAVKSLLHITNIDNDQIRALLSSLNTKIK